MTYPVLGSLMADEPARLDALRSFDVLDTPPEAAFDDLVRLAAQLCGTPMALVSLVDADRQWFKARIGLGLSSTERRVSFCAHAVALGALLVVPDAQLDPRFADNPLVTGEPWVRFYAGAPMVTDDGFVLGSLCVLDVVPRTLSALQLEQLTSLARQAMGQLELRRQASALAADVTALAQQRAVLAESERRWRALFSGSPVGIGLSDENGLFVSANPALCALLGRPAEDLIGRSSAEFTHPDDRHRVPRLDSADGIASIEKRYVRPNGSRRWAWLTATHTPGPTGQTWTLAHVQDITERREAEQAIAASEANLAAVAAVVQRIQSGADARQIIVEAGLQLADAA